MLDIVIVSYEHELPMLDLCLRSIEKHVDKCAYDKILLFWNDDLPQTVDDLRSRITRHYGIIADRIDIILREIITTNPSEKIRPWRAQQALKLLAARYTQHDYYLTIDTKNHFLKPFGYTDLFAQNGKPKSSTATFRGGPFLEFLKVGLDYFKTPFEPAYAMNALPTITPNILSATLVNRMLDQIEQREERTFFDAFMTVPPLNRTAEFLLYYAYLLSDVGSFEAVYHTAPKACVTFFTTDPDTNDLITKKIAALNDPATKVLGIHRNRYLTMSAREREAFKLSWVDAGLCENHHDAELEITKIREHFLNEK